MRDPQRIPQILNALKRIWQKNPDLRLAQLLVIAAKPQGPCPQIFYKQDNELLKGLLNLEQELETNT